MVYKSLTAVTGNVYILRTFQSVLLSLKSTWTLLPTYTVMNGDLGFIQTYTVPPALDSTDPLQTQPGKVAETLPRASEAAARAAMPSATYKPSEGK